MDLQDPLDRLFGLKGMDLGHLRHPRKGLVHLGTVLHGGRPFGVDVRLHPQAHLGKMQEMPQYLGLGDLREVGDLLSSHLFRNIRSGLPHH